MTETSATVASLLRRIAQEVESAGVMPETLADIDQRLLHGPGNSPGWLPQRFTELVRTRSDRSLQATLRATLIVLGRIMRERKAAAPEIRQLRACAEALGGGGNGAIAHDAALYRPQAELMKVFGVNRRTFERFLERHPSISWNRPLTKAGTPDPHRRNIHMLDFCRALRGDDRMVAKIASQKRIESNMQRLKIGRELQKAALELFGI